MESSSSTSDLRETDYNATARDHLITTAAFQFSSNVGNDNRDASENQNSGTVFSVTIPKRDKHFRRLIIELSKKLCSDELETAKFLFGGEIKKRKMEKIKTLMDLCRVLQERCLLNENKLGCLLELFEALGRCDLVELVKKYEGNSSEITYAKGNEIPSGATLGENSHVIVATESNNNISETQTNDFVSGRSHQEGDPKLYSDMNNEDTLTQDKETQTIGEILDTCDQFQEELKYLSNELDTEKRMRLDMQELLFCGWCETYNYSTDISKLYMQRNEMGLKFLRSKLLRVYPQCLYDDIYS